MMITARSVADSFFWGERGYGVFTLNGLISFFDITWQEHHEEVLNSDIGFLHPSAPSPRDPGARAKRFRRAGSSTIPPVQPLDF